LVVRVGAARIGVAVDRDAHNQQLSERRAASVRQAFDDMDVVVTGGRRVGAQCQLVAGHRAAHAQA
ncbi:MAG: hypothetical protein EOP67_18005, partial [Sphingomonas sp.]